MEQPVLVMISVWRAGGGGGMVFTQADGTIIAMTDKLLSVLVSFPTRFWESGDSIDLSPAAVNNTTRAAARTVSHTCRGRLRRTPAGRVQPTHGPTSLSSL